MTGPDRKSPHQYQRRTISWPTTPSGHEKNQHESLADGSNIRANGYPMAEITRRLALTDKRALEAKREDSTCLRRPWPPNGGGLWNPIQCGGCHSDPHRDESEDLGRIKQTGRGTRIAAKRFGEPAEVTDLVLFLASDAYNFMGGQMIHLDGSLTAI